MLPLRVWIKFKYFAQRFNRRIFPLVFPVLVIGGVIILAQLRGPKEAEAAWWDDSWLYRKKVAITNAGSAQTDFQVKVLDDFDTASLVSAGKIQADCDDIRFTDISGKLLPYWIESGCNTSTTDVWTKIPSIPTSGATIYLYYGNPSAAPYQNGENVFEFFDDFSGDLSKWTIVAGNWAIENGELSQSDETGGNSIQIYATGKSFSDYIAEAKIMFLSTTKRGGIINRVATAGSSGTYYDFWFGDDSKNNIYQWVNGPVGYVVQGANVPSGSIWYDFKSTLSGSSLTHEISGVETISGTNTATASGSIGLRTYASHAHFADIRVRKYAATEPSAGSAGSEEQAPGPAAYWKLDEGYGQTANDSTQNNNDGTLGSTGGSDSNDPTWTEEARCVAGKCLQFDGTNDYVSIANTISNTQTVSFWVKPSTTTEYFIDLNGSAYISASSGTISATGFTSRTIYVNGAVASTLTANQWQHIAVTTGTAISASAITIGKISTNYLQGFIDDPKIYPYARTASEIQQDFVRGTRSPHGASAVLGSPKDQGDFLSQGLVGYWKMDESSWNGTSGEVTDSSGNGNNGTASCDGTCSVPTTTGGKFGDGGSFDGTDDWVEIGGGVPLPTDNITASAWIKTSNTSSTPQDVFAGEWNSGSSGFLLGTINGKLRQFFYTGTNNYINGTAGPTVADGSWHNVIWTFQDGDGNFYVDGELQSDLTVDGSGSIVYDGTHQTKIGRDSGDCCTEYWNGQIDEVRVYNRVLSPKEVRDLHNWAPGPVLHLKMDEKVSGDSQTLRDTSTYGNDGTTNWGANASGMDCTKPGKFGSACEFDGSDDYVSVSDSNDWNIVASNTDGGSISLWVKHNDHSGSEHYISHEDSEAGGTGSWYFRHVDGQGVTFIIQVGGGPVEFELSGLEITDTDWHHVAMSKDANEYRIYVDGVQTGYDTSNEEVYADGPLTIAWIPSWPAATLDGLIDEVKVYNYARTQKQIVEDMNAGHPAVGTPVGSAVSHWKFDEGYGDTANDSGFGGNNGDLGSSGTTCPQTGLSACPSWTNDGKFGKALSFDGTDDYVDCGNDSSLDSTGEVTISVWIKTPGKNVFHTIASKLLASPWKGFNFVVNSDANGGKLQIWAGATPPLDGVASVNDNQWHHVVATVTGTTANLYIDGSLDNSGTVGNDLSEPTASVLIGDDISSANRYFNGLIDEVKIYNFALAEDEIRLEYNRGSAVVMGATGTDASGDADWSQAREYCVPGDTTACNPPVAEWKFDEKTGSYAYDTSGNGNTGTISGASWTTGKIGAALNFSDTGDKLTVSSVSLSGDYTLGAWFVYPLPTPSEPWNTLFRGSSPNYNHPVIVRRSDMQLGYFDNSGGTGFNGSGFYMNSLSDGWHHLVAVGSGSSTVFHIDGRNVGTAGAKSSNDIVVIANLETGIQQFGTVDHVRIYNYARTPAQIAWDYNRGAPVAHYKFDECQGTTAHSSNDPYDSSLDGTITIGGTGTQTSAGTCTDGQSTSAWYNGSAGKFNYSLSFDGTDDLVSIPDKPEWDFGTGDFTIMFWEKAEASNTGGRIARDNNNYSAFLIGHTGGLVYMSSTGSGWDIADAKTIGTPPVDTWSFVAVKREGNNFFTYRDGVQMDTWSSSLAFVSSALPLEIGRTQNIYYTTGQIDDVRIYNYALTLEQIQQAYNEGAIRFGPQEGSP